MKKNDKKEKKRDNFPGPIMKGKMQKKKQNDKKRKKEIISLAPLATIWQAHYCFLGLFFVGLIPKTISYFDMW